MENLKVNKFRSWNDTLKQFTYFLDGNYYTDMCCDTNSLCRPNLFFWWNAEQYINIKDGNKNEVYEGDIDMYDRVICFRDLTYNSFGAFHTGFYFYKIDANDKILSHHDGLKQIFIKGNIHEK